VGTVCETEVDFLAQTIIVQHGDAAPLAAEHHLDQLVKAGSPRWETWISVIDVIHMIRCRERGISPPGALARTWQTLFRG
jgi:hypothetical protein